MIKAVLVGGDKLESWLKSRYPQIRGQLETSMARLVISLTRKIKQEKLTGQVLKNKTGTLRRSISPDVTREGENLVGSVGTNIEYARIHEFGGKTLPYEIRARKAQALAFFTTASVWGHPYGPVIVKKVMHPGSVFPERSFMRSALREMEPEIRKEFEKAIREGVKDFQK